jgi:parallel beta-helix repeat protein
MKRFVSGLMLILLITSMLTLMFNVQPVRGEWTGTVYILADGSIDPPDAPIITYDNITYTLTGNISSSASGIIIQRDNIIVNGNGYTIQGSGANDSKGIAVSSTVARVNRQNVTVKNFNIRNFWFGILLYDCYNCYVYRNNITTTKMAGIESSFSGNITLCRNYIADSNWAGITLDLSGDICVCGNDIERGKYGIYFTNCNCSTIRENNVKNNWCGIGLYGAYDNRIYHNNFLNNSLQTYIYYARAPHIWDDGYPSGGNYWSDYVGVDERRGPNQNLLGSDGIGDTPYIIDENNQDRYPLMNPWPIRSYVVAEGADEYSTAFPHQRKLAKTLDGSLHAVYHKKDANGILQVYHAESSDGGKTWIEEKITNATTDQCFPALAADSYGNLHLVWEEGWPSKPGIVPYTYYKKKVAGSWQDSELVASYATFPAIAIDSHDNVHVVYGTYVYEPGYWGGGNGIRWRLRTSDGWQAEESISSEKYWVRYAAIAIDSKDNVHVVWSHAPKYRYYDIHYRKRTASGWETEVEISSDSDSTAAYPSIAIDGNDRVHIVWHYQENASSNGAIDGYWSIRHRVYTDSWQPIEIIAGPTKYLQLYPSLAIDDQNNLHVIWFGQHFTSPNMYQIRYRRHTTSWQPIEELTSSTSKSQTFPSLMWAFYPIIDNEKVSQFRNGCAFVWMDGTTIRYREILTLLKGADLCISSSDVSFSEDNPFDGQTITITATVHNIGEETAENVTVRFLDGEAMIGEQKIPFIYPGSNGTASIQWTAKGEGFHPIKVVVDPYNAIIETDESNNEATRSILVGQIPFVGGIIVEASVIPETTIAGSTVTIRGSAKYNTTYGAGMPVAGADVSILITGWMQEKTYTVRDGTFEASITAPYTPGYYTILVTVTDFTFIERVELGLNVTVIEGVDLTLSTGDISFSPSDPVEGQSVNVTATLHNIGTIDAYIVLVAFYDSGKLIGNGTINVIPSGATANIIVSWNAMPWGWHTIKVVVDPANTIAEVNENNNEASKRIYVYLPLPDLTPTSIVFSDSTPAVNQTTTISANIRNIGGVSASNVLISFYVDGQPVENVTIAWIGGKGCSQTASIQYSFATAGWHEVCVVADPENIILEMDENNNRLCKDIYVHQPMPDLTPGISFSNDNPTVGDIITIYITICNIGEIDAQNVTLSIFDDDVRIGYLTILLINSGGHETVEVLWNATPAGWHRIKAVVDENNTIEEVDETNNIATRYIYVSPPPEQTSDLCIRSEDIAFSKVVVEEGEEVKIYATVHNIGMVEAQNVTVTFYIDDVQLGSPKTIASIPVSGSETVSTKWTASKAGSHVVKVVADAPMEANKTNNVATRGIIVGEHNVAITNVTPSKNVVEPGEILSINITATNKGSFMETFNLTLYANATTIQTIGLTLESGNSTTVTFMWDTAGFVYGNYTIWAYIEPVPRETITEDNTYIDGTVQILQIYTLTIISTTGGTTNPAPGTYTHTASSMVQVTAIPNSGYIFDHWELNGSNVGSANPYTVHMDSNYTLKAYFAPAPAPLTVSISPTSASILVGQQLTFTSTVSGGTPPYAYQWYLDGEPFAGANSNSWTFKPTAPGIYYVFLKVTDAKGNTAQSDAARITVATVPVGGYSIPIQLPTTAKPVTIHIALLTIITAIFITIKQKTRRKHRQ